MFRSPIKYLKTEEIMSSQASAPDRITVVIPTLNESGTVADIIRRTKPYSSDIMVVDGHSTDDTIPIATKMGARIVFDNKGTR